MLKIIYYFLQIRLRKFFGKIDFSIYLIVFAFYIFGGYILLQYIEKYSYYFLLFSLEILRYHNRRKDLELLKFRQNYKAILYVEYSIYSLVFTVSFLISLQWLHFIVYQILLLIYLYLPTYKTYIFKYPFKLFDPFWVICFRKNKLFLSLIPVLFFTYTGSNYENENLILFTFLIIVIVLCIPSFQREPIYFIKVSNHKEYLSEQIKTNIYNSLFLIIPTSLIILSFGKFQLLLFIPLVLVPMFFNILIKYTLFKRLFQQQILFAIIIGGFQYFLPFIAIPFLIYHSRKTLKLLRK